jgi:haloalkane dehalogenase
MEVRRTPDARFADLPDFPFEPRYQVLRDGLRLHYVETGPADGEPVLLLHGQPTWSYLYRFVLPVLADDGFRAIAPDLIGFGRSDKPGSRQAYSVRAHIGWLHEFVEQVDLPNLTLVAQDWGGPLGLGILAREPDRFARVVVTNTVLHTADASLNGALTWACHTDQSGQVVIEPALLDYQRMTQELAEFHPSLFVQGATETDVAPASLAAYDAPFPDESFCAGPRQLPLLMGLSPASECARRNRRAMRELATFGGPFLTAFSDGDPATRGWADVLQSHVPGAAGMPHVTIERAGHFLQEDSGIALADVVARFVGGTPPH